MICRNFGGLPSTMHKTFLFLSVIILFLLSGCDQTITPAPSTNPPPTPHNALLGGAGTIRDITPNAFSRPISGLTREQERLFFVGNSFFNQNWVTAPASTTARDGLGPYFNARSCASCHFKDGRGRPPEFDGEHPTGFLIRVSQPGRTLSGAVLPDPVYGGQLQDQAIDTLAPEVVITIVYEEVPFVFPDGTTVQLRQPNYQFSNLAYGALHPEGAISARVANQMIGLGLLEAISEETLIALADPTDQNGDGISGRPNYVWDKFNHQMTIGRFGWKANQPHLLQQTADAFLGDIGITTSLNPHENCTHEACEGLAHGGSPEITDDDLLKVVLYSSTLAVPAQRDTDNPQVQQGGQLFQEIGCERCHTATLQTAVHPTIPALSHQTIHPYTDLLLHDMGEGLADGRSDFQATGSEWRTPPLWGIGLFQTVNGHTYYLHDGRARTLEEAILWHGGEAETARQNYIELTPAERDAILRFLNSL